MLILLTGASGFLGSALRRRMLESSDCRIRLAARRPIAVNDSSALEQFFGLTLSETTDWSGALEGVDTVIHCAARVHVMNEQAADPLAEFRLANGIGTLRLARRAAAAGD